MKYFIKNLLIFLTLPVVFITFVGIILVSLKVPQHNIDANVTEIYVGDSHIQKAINDSLINNGLNIATSAESFYFSYYRLKKILKSPNSIKTIYLGFSYHSLSEYYDDFIFGKYSYSISPKYFFILPYKERLKLLKYNVKVLPSYIKNLFKEYYKQSVKMHKIGGYANNFRKTKASRKFMDRRIDLQYYSSGKLNNFSVVNQLYLKKIIKLCELYNIDLLVINTPLNQYYEQKIPIEYKERYFEIIKEYNLSVYDFKNLNLSDNCFVPDGDHLSVEGAIKMTKEFIKVRTHNN